MLCTVVERVCEVHPFSDDLVVPRVASILYLIDQAWLRRFGAGSLTGVEWRCGGRDVYFDVVVDAVRSGALSTVRDLSVVGVQRCLVVSSASPSVDELCPDRVGVIDEVVERVGLMTFAEFMHFLNSCRC